MFPSLVNYSQKSINEAIKNFNFLENATSISNKSFDLFFDLSISTEWLHFQAKTFSINAITHGYINSYKVLRIPPEEVENAYYELFIYSFVKTIYNGFFYSNISETANLGYSFIGHSQFFEIMKSPYNNGSTNGIQLSYRINTIPIAERRAILFRLISRFQFLSEFMTYSRDSFGTNSFYIQRYESFFNYMVQDYHSKPHLGQGAQEKVESKTDNNKKSNSNFNRDYPNGRFNIVELGKSSGSILNFNNSPIMNAFYSYDKKKFIFIMVGNGRDIEFNNSFIFSKASFLKLSDGNRNDIDRILDVYSVINLTENQDHLVCSEVYALTGIKCRMFNNDSKKVRFKLPDVKTVAEKLGKTLKSMDEILQALSRDKPIDIQKFIENDFEVK